jgi:hypothetical protein
MVSSRLLVGGRFAVTPLFVEHSLECRDIVDAVVIVWRGSAVMRPQALAIRRPEIGFKAVANV